MPHDRQPNQKLRVLPRAKTNLDLALTFFIPAKEGESCTSSTIETYRWSLERFIAWLRDQGIGQVEDLTANRRLGALVGTGGSQGRFAKPAGTRIRPA